MDFRIGILEYLSFPSRVYARCIAFALLTPLNKSVSIDRVLLPEHIWTIYTVFFSHSEALAGDKGKLEVANNAYNSLRRVTTDEFRYTYYPNLGFYATVVL